MTTLAQIQDAHHDAPKQRWALRGHLRVDETKVLPADQDLITRWRAISTSQDFDRALASQNINALFRRGVIALAKAGP